MSLTTTKLRRGPKSDDKGVPFFLSWPLNREQQSNVSHQWFNIKNWRPPIFSSQNNVFWLLSFCLFFFFPSRSVSYYFMDVACAEFLVRFAIRDILEQTGGKSVSEHFSRLKTVELRWVLDKLLWKNGSNCWFSSCSRRIVHKRGNIILEVWGIGNEAMNFQPETIFQKKNQSMVCRFSRKEK